MTIRVVSTASALVAGYALGSLITTFTPAAEAAAVAAGAAVYDSSPLQTPPGSIAPVARVLGQTGIPCVIANTGTVATNGAITLGTALPLTYPQVWLYLPAGAVVGGSAGWYYAVMSSTTVGQVYTPYVATMTRPYVPPASALVAAVGSNSSYTGATGADIQMGAATVPAGQLGTTGSLRYHGFFSHNSTAGNKIERIKFGSGTVVSLTATTTTGLTLSKKLQNRAAASQVIHATPETGAAVSVAPTLLSVDTTADVVASFTGQLAVATDVCVLECWSVELLPSP